MDDEDGRYGMASLYDNNGEMLVALASFAPTGNTRIALVQLIDFLVDLEDDAVIDVRVILEIIARGLVRLGFTDDDDGEHEHPSYGEHQQAYADYSELTPEETLQAFRLELGLDGEDDEDEEKK